MPYYRKWVCVELYVPVAVEAETGFGGGCGGET